MGVWDLLLVGLVILLGLYGVLLPAVPGSLLVWAGVMWWALTDPQPVDWWILVGATALMFVSQGVRWALPPRRLRASRTTHRTLTYAGAGSTLGFVLLPVVGAIPGFLAGLYLAERLRLGRRAEAVAAVRTVMRSGGSSVLAELFTCQLIAAAWMGAVFGA
ncbi:DUF456 family protein [Streptomyces sp. NPDC007991]|uniref:DUF456 domain-containing protein n=1 Tax=Streptomyces sp. NPDC007991 TaxID=3364803 RepID=UPI0036E60839